MFCLKKKVTCQVLRGLRTLAQVEKMLTIEWINRLIKHKTWLLSLWGFLFLPLHKNHKNVINESIMNQRWAKIGVRAYWLLTVFLLNFYWSEFVVYVSWSLKKQEKEFLFLYLFYSLTWIKKKSGCTGTCIYSVSDYSNFNHPSL